MIEREKFMSNNIYNISIEREALRCNQEGKMSKLSYPDAFGDKNKNKLITIGKIEEQFKIVTPISDYIGKSYIKLEEITDVILYEIHERNELLLASTKPNYEDKNAPLSYITVNFKLNEAGIRKVKSKFNIPNTIEEIYNLIKIGIEGQIQELEKIYGLINVEVDTQGLHISNIELNPYERCGISVKSLMHLILIIFQKMTNSIDLEELNNKLGLKCKDGLDISSTKEEMEKAKTLTDEEILNLTKDNMKVGFDERYRLKHYPALVSEAIVLVKDALSQGIDCNVLNEETSFVELKDSNGHREFVIEGNKTDRDNYIFPIVTDDKMISKNLMHEQGLNVPKAELLYKDTDEEIREEQLSEFYDSKVVIKPRNTNKGVGITVFSEKATKNQILQAVDYAFQFDKHVLIEEYVEGMEYRFLVVDGKCISICHRRPASLVGDGKSTIRELANIKNKEPWHALTFTPVKLDEPVEIYLKMQQYTLDSIPKEGERIFLRTNSNCSTGGESIDMTDVIPEYFKNIAEKAANVFNAKISGVDIIIDDINSKDYSIIEINDNPGYSINEWPYEGKGEKVGIAILKLLGY